MDQAKDAATSAKPDQNLLSFSSLLFRWLTSIAIVVYLPVEQPLRQATAQRRDLIRFADIQGLGLDPVFGFVHQVVQRGPLLSAHRADDAPAMLQVLLDHCNTLRRANQQDGLRSWLMEDLVC